MRSIAFETIKEKVKEACIETNYILGEDVIKSLQRALEQEESPLGREILNQLIENARIAREEKIPLCETS